jgi:hypothetical protein
MKRYELNLRDLGGIPFEGGVAILTRNWDLVKTGYRSFMADRKLIETAIKHYNLL